MMNTFSFLQYGENLGTRKVGAFVREQLLYRISEVSDEKLILDFTGVNVVANSFADECLAKLLLVMSLDELKQKTTFMGVNDMAKKCIAFAFQRRLQNKDT